MSSLIHLTYVANVGPFVETETTFELPDLIYCKPSVEGAYLVDAEPPTTEPQPEFGWRYINGQFVAATEPL